MKVYSRRNKEKKQGNLAEKGQEMAAEKSLDVSGGGKEGESKERTGGAVVELAEWTAGMPGKEERENRV